MAKTATENYADTYNHSIGFGASPALILVDFVQAYFDPESPLYADVDDALDSALRVRTAARDAQIPIIYTNVVYHPSMIDSGRFGQKAMPLAVFKQGSPLGAWPDKLEPAAGELVISKQYPSAFFGTSLASTLTAAGVDTLLITGLTTSGCVRATCVDSTSHGFIPIVVEDACGDRHTDPHRANLFDMHAKYGDVVREQTALDYLVSPPTP